MMTESEVYQRMVKDTAALGAVTKLRGFINDRVSHSRTNVIQRYVGEMPEHMQLRILDDYEAYLKDQVAAHGVSLPEPVK